MNEKYFYYAEVIWCWWEENVRKTAQEAIVLSARSYAEAAGMIEENYGEELHCIDRLECIGEGLMLPLSLAAGRDLRKAALDYGIAEVIEENDYSKPEPPVENTVKEIRWNPNKTPFPYDAPLGTVIICDNSSTSAKQVEDATYAQNWEGVAP